ncbi:hypothetical protein PI85_13915 [Lysinibacillus sp. A1]|nr:hypothetical protein HR49_04830 [Lysinibacillus fusiformis]KHK51463.1 hypothetical protein PI85_13915 [Lysinibacillus sp. A1]
MYFGLLYTHVTAVTMENNTDLYLDYLKANSLSLLLLIVCYHSRNLLHSFIYCVLSKLILDSTLKFNFNF